MMQIRSARRIATALTLASMLVGAPASVLAQAPSLPGAAPTDPAQTQSASTNFNAGVSTVGQTLSGAVATMGVFSNFFQTVNAARTQLRFAKPAAAQPPASAAQTATGQSAGFAGPADTPVVPQNPSANPVPQR